MRATMATMTSRPGHMWEPMLTLRKKPGVVTNTYFSDFFDHYCGNNDPDNWEKAIQGNREKKRL